MAATDEAMTVHVDGGLVQGMVSPFDDGVERYLGLPYAAPPVGDLRWRTPRPVPTWSGVRDATEFSTAPWQVPLPTSSVYSRGDMPVSEDCLYLNVWAPRERPAEPIPVMVWFHGGGNTIGHGNSRVFDGTRLVQKGVVVVTVNYRLGPAGFIGFSALHDEDEAGIAGNYGLHDQVASLEWVQRNIAGFGGDPERVTIFGQSAGATDTALLLTSPRAPGLIHRAISLSGAGAMTLSRTRAEATDAAAAAAGSLGVDPSDLATLRSLPLDRLNGAFEAASAIGPYVDGSLLTDLPRHVFARGEHLAVPQIVGSLADEFKGLAPDIEAMSMDEWRQLVARRFGSQAKAALAHYGSLAEQSTREATWAMLCDLTFTAHASAQAAASGLPSQTWQYFVTEPLLVFQIYLHDKPEFDHDGGPRSMGAYHSGELAYAFATTDIVGTGWEPHDHALAAVMSDYFVRFAATGDPNGAGSVHWSSRAEAHDDVMLFEQGPGMAPHPRANAIAIIET